MKALFLTSSLDTNDKLEDGTRVAKKFPNNNHIIDNLEKYLVAHNNLLIVASSPDKYDITDLHADVNKKSFATTLGFKNFAILDDRTITQAQQLINWADLILLSGGHVPTQNKFFHRIDGFGKMLQQSNAVVVGVSAGSMNCASTVYCPPEEEGEAVDPNFQRFFPGLHLTNINVVPHISDIRNEQVDGISTYNGFILPDSNRCDIVAIPDGSYILYDGTTSTVYGEAYLLHAGNEKKICDNGKSLIIDNLEKYL